MSEKELQAQLEELKRQLQELAERQEQTPQRNAESVGSTAPETEVHVEQSIAWLRSLTRHVGELLHEVKIDLNEVPAATALVLFAAGVFIGRMTSKH